MIGRGSRVTKTKNQFSIIDLGNNNHRFGLWEDFIDWSEVFMNPDKYLDQSYFDEIEKQRELNYTFPDEVICFTESSSCLLGKPEELVSPEQLAKIFDVDKKRFHFLRSLESDSVIHCEVHSQWATPDVSSP